MAAVGAILSLIGEIFSAIAGSIIVKMKQDEKNKSF